MPLPALLLLLALHPLRISSRAHDLPPPARLRSMVSIPGGWVTTGSAYAADAIPGDGELPRRAHHLRPFAIGADEVTCEQFAAFASATGHVTTAERLGSSFVAAPFLDASAEGDILGALAAAPHWYEVANASWRHPRGGASHCDASHPVVHVSAADGAAFCEWAVEGGRLPSEAEWEHAARGGRLPAVRFPWGDGDADAVLHRRANTFTGVWPHAPDAADGHRGAAPVGSFPRNGYGLADMAGNVWEWTVPTTTSGGAVPTNVLVQKGGSCMCHRSTCWRYRISARVERDGDSTAGHVGFRCCADAPAGGERDAL